MRDPDRVVLLDNVDSFSFNLVEELRRRGATVEVHRNDRPAAVIAARALEAGLLVISPGPGSPAEAGSCLEVIGAVSGRVPIFGVCLGLQAIVEAFGGRVGRAPRPVHGKATALVHRGDHPLLAGLPSPMTVGRYHSLAATLVPPALEILAESDDVVMAVAHRALPIAGVQFHPESVLTPQGARLMQNVLAWAGLDAGTALPKCPPDAREVAAGSTREAVGAARSAVLMEPLR